MIRCCFICVIIVLNIFCDADGQNKEDLDCKTTINVQVDSIVQSENELIRELKFLKLETNSESVLESIAQLDISNDKIYALDKNSNEILIFDLHSGAFLNKIITQGRGKGEVVGLANFIIDDGEILLMDHTQTKLVTLNEEGDLIREKKLPYNFSNFAKLNNHFIFSNGLFGEDKWMYQLFITDTDFNIVNKSIPILKNEVIDIILSPALNVSKHNNTINFQPIYKPSLWSIKEDMSIEKKYCFDFHDSWVNNELVYTKVNSTNPFDQVNKIADSGKAYFVNFIEGDKFVVSYFNKKPYDNQLFFIYNKQNKESAIFESEKQGVCGKSDIFYPYKDYFVSVKYKEELDVLKETYRKKLSDEQIALIEKMKSNDNPVLVFIKFKI